MSNALAPDANTYWAPTVFAIAPGSWGLPFPDLEFPECLEWQDTSPLPLDLDTAVCAMKLVQKVP